MKSVVMDVNLFLAVMTETLSTVMVAAVPVKLKLDSSALEDLPHRKIPALGVCQLLSS